MPSLLERPLPVPMKASTYAEELVSATQRTALGDRVGIVTMQMAMRAEDGPSQVSEIVDELLQANDRGVDAHITVDGRYTGRMTRIGNRDFPDFLPILTRNKRLERIANRQATNELFQELIECDLLIESDVRPFDRGYTPWLRQAGSLHLLQFLAARHAKASYVARTNGETVAWITSANHTDSDLHDPDPQKGIGMNNLAFRVEGNMARFVIGALEGGFGRISGSHRYESDGVTLLHDVNNSGNPARLPSILQEVLASIDPKRSELVTDPTETGPKMPTHILTMSQYLPDGLLGSALRQAALHADVYVPTQPQNDHRSKSFPYNLHSFIEGRRLEKAGAIITRRKVPSHVKSMVVRYDDRTARIIGGTDNFMTHLQKFVRNEELALVVDLDLKKERDAGYYQDFISLIHTMGEITCSTRDSLID